MELRPASTAEYSFIIPTWSRSFKKSRAAGTISSKRWAAVMYPEFNDLLERPSVKTLVLADADFLYGWAAAERTGIDVLHYVYVKESYRRAGLANRLLDGLGVPRKKFFIFTHWTPIVLEFAEGTFPLAKHDPNFARYANYKP